MEDCLLPSRKIIAKMTAVAVPVRYSERIYRAHAMAPVFSSQQRTVLAFASSRTTTMAYKTKYLRRRRDMQHLRHGS